MTNEKKLDLIESWNEVNEALTSLTDLSDEEIIECLPAIRDRLEIAQNLLGKYVTDSDLTVWLNKRR